MSTQFPVRAYGQTTLRQLKLLVALLVLSNIGLGLFSSYLLRKTDQRYGQLIENSVPVLGDLQDLTVISVRVMRMTNSTSFPGGQPGGTIADVRKVLDEERAILAKVLNSDWVAPAVAERADLQSAVETFTKIADEVAAQLTTGSTVEAGRMRDELLRPAFDRNLASLANAGDLVERESRRASHDVSRRAEFMSTVMLSLAGWPVVLLAGLLVVTISFVVVLMIVLRDRVSSEVP